MYTTRISINTQFLLFIGKLQGGPNSYPLLVHLVYIWTVAKLVANMSVAHKSTEEWLAILILGVHWFMIYFQMAAEHCFGALFARQNRTYFSQQQIVHKSKLSTQTLLQNRKKSPFGFPSFLI